MVKGRPDDDDATQAGGDLEWSLPEGWQRQHAGGDGEGEERVAGVYPRLLLRQPGFPLRDPRGTLQASGSRFLSPHEFVVSLIVSWFLHEMMSSVADS